MTIKEGNDKAIKKIEKDIVKANKELKYLGKWREYKDTQLYFIINSVGGHIPVLSNVLTLIYTFEALLSKEVERRNNWTMLNTAPNNG